MDTKRFLLHLLVGTATLIIILLISLQFPVVGVLTSLFIPLPIMVLCGLWGLWGGILALLIGTLAISVFINPLLGIVFSAEFGLLGILLYHYLVRKSLPWDHVVARSSLIVLAVLACLVIVYGMAIPSDFIEWIQRQMDETGRSLFRFYPSESAGDHAPWMSPENLVALTLRILPALIILTLWLEGVLNVVLFARIMNRHASGRGEIILRPRFSTWSCPDRLVWGGILGGFLILTKVSPLVTVGLNAVILFVAIYFLQGLAVVSFLFKKNNVPLGFRVVGYAMVGVIQLLFFLVVALGLFDIWINFRKLTPRITAYKKSF